MTTSSALAPSNDAESEALDAAAPVALRLPLSGTHLIEASAGSGKTWTLVALFLRLVIEAGLPVEQILTVTFTRAATAELRQRIRRELIACRDALDGAPASSLTRWLVAGDSGLARSRIRQALAVFDTAPIYTIHGFAQRALGDRAFSAGTSFELELGDTDEVWHQAVHDFWRRNIVYCNAEQNASPATHRELLSSMLPLDTAARWLDWLLKVCTARHPRLLSSSSAPLIQQESIIEMHRDVAVHWQRDRAELEALLLNHPALNKRSLSRATVPRWCTDLDIFFSVPAAREVPSALERFSRDGLRAKLKSADLAPPEHPLIDQLTAYFELRVAYRRGLSAWRQRLLLKMFDEVPKEVAARLREQRLLGYDDLLVRLDELLTGHKGLVFATALRTRYKAALIDEFQDTDALQDRIFQSIYGADTAAPVFLVGDPKQAIYRFRGADIFTYLAAAKRTGQRHALLDNYRSSPGLIAALNLLYQGCEAPFSHEAIRYVEVRAAERTRQALIDQGLSDPAPLRLIVPDDHETPSGAEALQRAAANAVAAEIAHMLASARAGSLTIGARALVAGDIAVLVKTNAQGRLIRLALRSLGIGAADRSRGNVLASEEADWLLVILLAAAQPHRAERIKNALATPLFGYSAAALLALGDDEASWQHQLEAFANYQLAWQQSGVMRLLRTLLVTEPGAARMAASAEGERHLTNLFHLAELLQAERAAGLSLQAQIDWLVRRREPHLQTSEDAELRLESDENLIQVMTVHKSKGLEFPVVFVPFMYAGKPAPKERQALMLDMPVSYHDPQDDGQLVIDFGSPAFGTALVLADRERAAEEERLLYVALTRAMYRCVVFWDASPRADFAPLTRLFGVINPDDPAQQRKLMRERLMRLAARSGETLTVLETREGSDGVGPTANATAVLASRLLQRGVRAPWSLTSFSALRQRQLAAEVRDIVTEQPDHDQDAPGRMQDTRSVAPAEQALRFSFTRGALAGECLHTILERITFARDLSSQRALIVAGLAEHGLATRQAEALSDWLGEVMRTRLAADAFCLAELKAAQLIKEMQFHLPLAHAQAAELAPLAARHGLVIPALPQQRLDGFLKGFIDLVVQHRGRFYVIDYKSNWLGDRREQYAASGLASAMVDGGYHLQYLLYSLALMRWLRWRNPAFSFERDFGGVFYLFLRGMHDTTDPLEENVDGVDGVFAARPSQALLEDLDALFRGAS